MTLTLTQAIERTKDLSGELKAARTAKADCAADVEAKDRMADIARKALTNAEEHEARLMVEREELADHIAALVRLTGDPPPLAENGPDDRVECIVVETVSDFWHPNVEGADFQAEALANGIFRVTEAFNRSTQ
jgi:hypothetical protein